MFQNLGLVDRLIRLAAGVALVVTGFLIPSIWWVSLVAVVPLLTAGVGICPLYLPFGLSTIFKKSK